MQGAAVDAGLQYNYGHAGSKDDYSPFLNVSGLKGYRQLTPAAQHVPCGSMVALAFRVHPVLAEGCPGADDVDWKNVADPKCPAIAMTLTVDDVATKAVQVLTWIADEGDAPSGAVDSANHLFGGWGDLFSSTDASTHKKLYGSEAPCGGCIFKWMTSIGQKPPGHYHDGATFTATWSHRAIICTAVNPQCQNVTQPAPLTAALIDCTEYPYWAATYQFGTRDCSNTPTGASKLELSVGVRAYAPTGEIDAISLTH
jgi:hypothetical protein